MTATTATRTIAAKDLKVGDILITVWGTTLNPPRTVTSVDISPTYGGGFVKHNGGGFLPVRANDTRPIEVAS